MQLGELISRLEDESDAAAALEALGDIVLLAEVEAERVAHDETPGEYAANASRRFAAMAGSEDWLALMNAMERADDPGRAALAGMLRWALKRDREAAPAHAGEGGCGCGGGGGCHGAG